MVAAASARHAAAGGRASIALARPLAGGAVLIVGGALAASGAYSAWTSSSSRAINGTAATVTATHLDTNGTVFTTAVTNLVPGDFLYRYSDLTNTGSVSQAFTGATTGGGTLGTAATGLTIQVDACAAAWVANVCATPTVVKAVTSVATNPAITYSTLPAAGVQHLRYTFGLPTNADQTTLQGQTGSITVAVTGTAAAGTDRTAG